MIGKYCMLLEVEDLDEFEETVYGLIRRFNLDFDEEVIDEQDGLVMRELKLYYAERVED